MLSLFGGYVRRIVVAIRGLIITTHDKTRRGRGVGGASADRWYSDTMKARAGEARKRKFTKGTLYGGDESPSFQVESRGIESLRGRDIERKRMGSRIGMSYGRRGALWVSDLTFVAILRGFGYLRLHHRRAIFCVNGSEWAAGLGGRPETPLRSAW